MTGIITPPSGPVGAYIEELRAYHLRLAAWLDLDPTKVMSLEDVDRKQTDPSPIAMPPGVDVTWQTLNERVAAGEHEGRHPMPTNLHGVDGVTTFIDGVHLDWSETERLRVEVGERPQFPAPAGGWPAHWPQP